MNAFKIKIPLLLLTNLMISGCAPHMSKNANEDALANKIISEKVSEAAEAQRQYTAIINNDKAVLGRKQSSFYSDLVDFDFYGQPQEALQSFSFRYGYRYVENGKWRKLKPINIRVVNSSPEEILRNIGYQIDKGGDITLDQKSKFIRLTYK
ncbi:DotD/TraH family lipoprotein [Acerihabitans sp. TG2]|uniref:DotD/TraH family lipoprotein n=1 Tax=Acerihabitans sp. TG2 TaxID=3096008 RepID=UPI002B235759|nr:DotD/TraH family lipoprotein [Acerihabitans sp. TG2]MEA9392227.1 DotD/TraH family lipoprotein [Acerihabitans sp. TG2]